MSILDQVPPEVWEDIRVNGQTVIMRRSFYDAMRRQLGMPPAPRPSRPPVLHYTLPNGDKLTSVRKDIMDAAVRPSKAKR